MNRNQKLKLLQAFIDGKLDKDCLLPPKVYVFIQRIGKSGYEMDGRIYSKKEVEAFERRIDLKNRTLGRRGDLPKDICIMVEFKEGMTIL